MVAPTAPSYDFEKMIEEAMKKDGAAPAVGPPPLNQKNDGAVDSAQDNGQGDKSNKKKKPMDKKKQDLLEKRKKYDPRAAIKNAKKSPRVENSPRVEEI
jgi:hypothetical protein